MYKVLLSGNTGNVRLENMVVGADFKSFFLADCKVRCFWTDLNERRRVFMTNYDKNTNKEYNVYQKNADEQKQAKNDMGFDRQNRMNKSNSTNSRNAANESNRSNSRNAENESNCGNSRNAASESNCSNSRNTANKRNSANSQNKK